MTLSRIIPFLRKGSLATRHGKYYRYDNNEHRVIEYDTNGNMHPANEDKLQFVTDFQLIM